MTAILPEYVKCRLSDFNEWIFLDFILIQWIILCFLQSQLTGQIGTEWSFSSWAISGRRTSNTSLWDSSVAPTRPYSGRRVTPTGTASVSNGACHLVAVAGTTVWYPLILLNHCNSFEDRVPIDGYPDLSNKLLWLDLKVGFRFSSLDNGHQGNMPCILIIRLCIVSKPYRNMKIGVAPKFVRCTTAVLQIHLINRAITKNDKIIIKKSPLESQHVFCSVRDSWQGNIVRRNFCHPILSIWDFAGSSGIILRMGSANERQCYIVTSSLIGWAHTQTDLWP